MVPLGLLSTQDTLQHFLVSHKSCCPCRRIQWPSHCEAVYQDSSLCSPQEAPVAPQAPYLFLQHNHLCYGLPESITLFRMRYWKELPNLVPVRCEETPCCQESLLAGPQGHHQACLFLTSPPGLASPFPQARTQFQLRPGLSILGVRTKKVATR